MPLAIRSLTVRTATMMLLLSVALAFAGTAGGQGVPGSGPNKCLAGKNKCVSKKMKGLLKSREKCQKSPAKCGQVQTDCETRLVGG